MAVSTILLVLFVNRLSQVFGSTSWYYRLRYLLAVPEDLQFLHHGVGDEEVEAVVLLRHLVVDVPRDGRANHVLRERRRRPLDLHPTSFIRVFQNVVN